jgi:glycosyltransferase involved in cell wall biosynthesis
MNLPKVSIIVPIDHHSERLAAAVQSVLHQTYSNFELIVVDGIVSDLTSANLSRFADQRVKQIRHVPGHCETAIIETGIAAATGELITFLGHNDTLHAEKLQVHVKFLEKHSNVGASCNARIETDSSGLHLCLWQPPSSITLSDLITGLPLSLDDVVLRREWATKLCLTNGTKASSHCETLSNRKNRFNYRLALAGCRFAGVTRALNQRRPAEDCGAQEIQCETTSAIDALESVFAAPDCPADVRALRDKALGRAYLALSYRAFKRHQSAVGQQLLRQSIQRDRSILDSKASGYLGFLALNAFQEGGEHELLLRNILAQLPPELAWITRFSNNAVALAYLHRGASDVLWGRTEEGQAQLMKAATMEATLTKSFLHYFLNQLVAYEAEFGSQSVGSALHRLSRSLHRIGTPRGIQRFHASYLVNRAFKNYHQNQFQAVPADALKAILLDPTYLANRGVWSIFFRSLFNSRLR